MFETIGYKNFESQRKFGLEMEVNNSIAKKKIGKLIENISNRRVYVSGYTLTTCNNYWHIKDDATCGDNGKGVEIASFIAKGSQELEHISNVAEVLEMIGCRTNIHCGLHIHADASDLKEEHVGNLLAYWIKLENIMSASLPKIRRNSMYCRPISSTRGVLTEDILKRQWTGKELWMLYKPEKPSLYYGNEDRRVNFNLVNYSRAICQKTTARKTLELRWPEGTLSPVGIRSWVRLFLGFIDNCKNKAVPKNLYPYFDIEDAMDVLGFSHAGQKFQILSESLYETKVWFLERIIINSPDSNWAYQAKDILKKIK